MNLESIETDLARIYGHGDWILVGELAVGFGDAVELLKSWGADRLLLVAGTRGIGDVPDDLDIHYTNARGGGTIMDGLRAFDGSLSRSDTIAVIDRFDPRRSARVLAPIFGGEDAFEGRRVYGRRRREWRALEDKTAIDAVFRDAGVEVAAHEIVSVSNASHAASRLGSAKGTVWVADNRQGWHGGGEYTRWVPDSGAHEAATSWFADRADLVRVMPFLEGIPCSIHGYVTADHVATFRPVEMLVARASDSTSFRYLGTATTWDPPVEVREEMRAAARTVGRHLARTVGYLGPFSIDGVATTSGFRPTELNPRLSAGLGIQARTVDGLRLSWMTRALYEGDLEIDAVGLERAITRAADRARVVRALVNFAERRDPATIEVVLDAGRVRRATSEAHGTLSIGESSGGSVAMLQLAPEHVPVGQSFGGAAISAAQLAADTWNLDLESLEPALDVTGDSVP